MRRSILAILLALPALFAGVWLALGEDPVDSIANRLDRSVVRIFVVGPQGKASGTGFVVNRDGVVATNFHVVQAQLLYDIPEEMSWSIFVVDRVAGKVRRRPAELVQAFPGEDLAILRVDGLDRPPVIFAKLGDHELTKGLEVFAIGFPGAADRLGPVDEASFVRGAVSRTFSGPWAEGAPTIQIIQHSAPTNPGNSGGPLVDLCGYVVGINSQREARVLVGPGGITLVTDPIQGVFYASSADVLTGKLEESKIAFEEAKDRCGSGLMGALRRGPDNILAIGAIMLSITGLGLLFRPRAVVQVVVYCGDAVGACAQAIERAVQNLRSNRKDKQEISVTAGKSPPEHERKTEA